MTKNLGNTIPNSTLCGNAELGDNNQVQIALVIYLLNREKIGGKLLLDVNID